MGRKTRDARDIPNRKRILKKGEGQIESPTVKGMADKAAWGLYPTCGEKVPQHAEKKRIANPREELSSRTAALPTGTRRLKKE